MSELTTAESPASPGMEGSGAPHNPFFEPGQTDQLPRGAAMERLTLDAGPVVLTCPAELDKESVKEFEYWVNGVVRRARRKAGLPIDGTTDK